MDSHFPLFDIFAFVIFIVISGIALFGNGTVLFTIYKHPCLQNSFNASVFSLALADMCFASLNMPLSVVDLISNSQIRTKPLCLAQTTMFCLVTTVSLTSLALMTINRYYRVVKPTHFQNVFSRRRTLILLLLSWIVSLALPSVTLFALSPLAMYKRDDIICYRLKEPLLGLFVYIILFVVSPSAIILIFYINTMRFIYKRRASIHPISRIPTIQEFYIGEAKTLRVLLILLLCSYFCVIPAIALWLVKGTMSEPSRLISVLVKTFQLLTTIVIPAVYIFVSRYYRKELWKIITCKCHL